MSLPDAAQVAAWLRPVAGRFWRMHRPRWAAEPLSGEGARRHGGRWNAPGQAALYLSAAHATAIAEAQQQLVEPGTLVPYDVRAGRIIDLTDPTAAEALDPADVRACEWQQLWRVERRRPPSWDLADALIGAGAQGLLMPSVVAASGANLVLWRWQGEPDVEVAVVDPLGALPRDGSSWR